MEYAHADLEVNSSRALTGVYSFGQLRIICLSYTF